MVKYNYCCINSECPIREYIHINKPEEERDVPEYCPECLEELKLMGEIIPGGYARFTSLSSQQRQEILVKRSKKHFQKKLKDKAIKQYRKA